MKYKFSIIVPIYKVEIYLKQCVESLINQTYKNIEIILVDDGSPDNCPKLCDEYAKKDSRIKVLHKSNGGLVSARKFGANYATGDYICCVDGDDFIASDYIEKFSEVAQQKEPDIICCGYILTAEKNKIPHILPNRKGFYTRTNIENEIFPSLLQSERGNCFLPTLWGKAIKKELYLSYQMKVSDKISMGEDAACTIPCFYNAQSVMIIDVCTYYYRYNTTSMTKAHKALKWDGPAIAGEHIKQQIDLNEFDFREQFYRRIAHGVFSVVVSQFYNNDTYSMNKIRIKKIMSEPLYAESIKNCHFRNSLKAIFMEITLKNKLVFLLYLCSKMK